MKSHVFAEPSLPNFASPPPAPLAASRYFNGRHFNRIALGAAASAVAADWLFHAKPVGWTVGVFAALLLTMSLLNRGWRALRSSKGWIVLLLTAGAIGATAEEPTLLPILFVIAGLFVLTVASRNGWSDEVGTWIGRAGRFFIAGPARFLWDNRIASRWFVAHPAVGGRPGRWGFLGAWALPAALGLVFVALFAVANPIIAGWANRAIAQADAALNGLAGLLNAGRIALWVFAFLIAWRLLRPRVGHWRKSPPPSSDVGFTLQPLNPVSRLAPSMVVRCLLVFNGVFAVQTAMDAAYLFGGAALPPGMTYAQYAHRGAYPLVATALLAAAFVLLTFRPGRPTDQSRACRWLVYAWIAQNVLLTLSATWRLKIYVDVYSLTRLRVAAGIWMLLVAAGLLLIVLRIVRNRDNGWLLRANLLAATAVLYACCFVNVPGLIADHNVRHCAEAGGAGPTIDVEYLRELGPAALPALASVIEKFPEGAPRARAGWHAAKLWDELREGLGDWRGWTLRRTRIARACPVRPDAPEIPPAMERREVRSGWGNIEERRQGL